MHPELRAAVAALDETTDRNAMRLLFGDMPGNPLFEVLHRAMTEPDDGDEPHPALVDYVRSLPPEIRQRFGASLQGWSRPGLPPHLRPVRGAYSPALWGGLSAEFAAARVAVEVDGAQ